MKQHEAGSYWGGIIKATGLAFGNIYQPDFHVLRYRHPHQAIPGKNLRHHFPDRPDGVTPTLVQPASLQNLYINQTHLNAKFMRNRIALIKWVQSVRTGPAILDAEAYAVRVYCYCPETGVYQGEDFIDECRLDVTEGVTRIAPPIYVCGEVPFFDTSTQCWHLIKLSGKRLQSMDQS
ncbi:MAG: hypothetical protein WCD00_00575 [Desulfuromonadaceae bacterium]